MMKFAEEMVRRGMNHKSPWPDYLVNGEDTEDFPELIETLEVMMTKLSLKLEAS
jgi:hypothetical protein